MYNDDKTSHTINSGSRLFLLTMIMLMIILSISPVSSAPPFTTNPLASGCQISPIVRDTLKVNTAFDFNFHVFNLTNGVPLSNSTLSCYFHFYNQTGDHVYSSILKNDPYSEHQVINEWAERMGGGNISKVGTYAYLVQCNSTQLGCADKGSFIVTNSGYEATTGRAIFDIGLVLLLLFFLGISIYGFMEIDNLAGKVGLFGFAYLLLIAITFIAWNMANDFLLSAQFLVNFLRILFIILVIGLFPLVIGAFAYYIIMITKIKEIQRLMDKGLDYNEAERRSGRKFK